MSPNTKGFDIFNSPMLSQPLQQRAQNYQNQQPPGSPTASTGFNKIAHIMSGGTTGKKNRPKTSNQAAFGQRGDQSKATSEKKQFMNFAAPTRVVH